MAPKAKKIDSIKLIYVPLPPSTHAALKTFADSKKMRISQAISLIVSGFQQGIKPLPDMTGDIRLLRHTSEKEFVRKNTVRGITPEVPTRSRKMVVRTQWFMTQLDLDNANHLNMSPQIGTNASLLIMKYFG